MGRGRTPRESDEVSAVLFGTIGNHTGMQVARADESFLEMSAGLPDLVPSKRLLTFACEAAKAVGVVHICMMLYRMA